MPLIGFDPSESCDTETLNERRKWWLSMRGWFADRGYNLYLRQPVDEGYMPMCYPPLPFTGSDTSEEAPFPYAFRGRHSLECGEGETYLSSTEPETAAVWYAQDAETRLVAIKIVKKDTDEYRIIHLIHEKQSSSLPLHGIVPVLDILDSGDFYFAIMPKWSIPFMCDCWFPSTREALGMIHCLLKACPSLRTMCQIITDVFRVSSGFMNEKLFTECDFKQGNTLVNFAYGDHWTRCPSDEGLQRFFCRRGMLTYGYIDYNIAVMFPRSASLSECRLPYWKSWDGTNNWWLYDTAQGEHDYDPFAFDVALLGFHLSESSLQHLPPYAPFVAPLLDMMVHQDAKKRFTAREALQFFDDMYPQLSEAELELAPPQGWNLSHLYETFDRWQDLPLDFVQRYRWVHYVVVRVRRFHSGFTFGTLFPVGMLFGAITIYSS
ncbi:uncharacterized protein ARMOST_07776 [Armillaria ostoyae]|uniref:Protein kinase domain-containing protein n=1 Tax=Armillaria ostoyae TaxID=47428 RepID=A0A284R6U8_ARMOS|nr:uncharacterized protein ARMOST_07776 [Armillaria ostoyae]